MRRFVLFSTSALERPKTFCLEWLARLTSVPCCFLPDAIPRRRYVVILRDAAGVAERVEDICAAFAPVVGPLSAVHFFREEPSFDIQEPEGEGAMNDTEIASGVGAMVDSLGGGTRRWDLGDLGSNSRPSRRPLACLMRIRGVCRHIYHGDTLLDGLAGSFTPPQLQSLKRCLGSHLDIAEPDIEVRVENAHPSGEPPPAPPPRQTHRRLSSAQDSWRGESLWNLDRLDQRHRPLDGLTSHPYSGGTGVHVYVVDSGVRTSHREFRDRQINGKDSKDGSRVGPGVNVIEGEFGRRHDDTEDCDGHGTHIAATVAGRDVGVAPNAVIHPVRVLDCDGGGRASDVVAGLEWVAAHVAYQRRRAYAFSALENSSLAAQTSWPTVVTLALGVPAGEWSRTLDRAVTALATRFDILVVVASGNFRLKSACGVSPSRVKESLTVGASDIRDGLYPWSATGECLDLFAPGVDIVSACGGINRCKLPGDDTYSTQSGTSMAVGHVAGAAALFLEGFPGAGVGEIKAALLRSATFGLVRGEFLPNTANRLLFVPPQGWDPPRSPTPQRLDTSAIEDETGDGVASRMSGWVKESVGRRLMTREEMLAHISKPQEQSGTADTAAAGHSKHMDEIHEDTREESSEETLLSKIFVNSAVESGWRCVSRGAGTFDLNSTGMITASNSSGRSSVIAALVPTASVGELRFVREKSGERGLPVSSSFVEFDLYVASARSLPDRSTSVGETGFKNRSSDNITGIASGSVLTLVVSDATTGASAAIDILGVSTDGDIARVLKWSRVSLPVNATGLSFSAGTWDVVAIRCNGGGDRGGEDNCLFYIDNLVVRARSER